MPSMDQRTLQVLNIIRRSENLVGVLKSQGLNTLSIESNIQNAKIKLQERQFEEAVELAKASMVEIIRIKQGGATTAVPPPAGTSPPRSAIQPTADKTPGTQMMAAQPAVEASSPPPAAAAQPSTGPNLEQVATYKQMLAQALEDGVITADEQAMLDLMRKSLGFTLEQERQMERELRDELNIQPAQVSSSAADEEEKLPELVELTPLEPMETEIGPSANQVSSTISDTEPQPTSQPTPQPTPPPTSQPTSQPPSEPSRSEPGPPSDPPQFEPSPSPDPSGPVAADEDGSSQKGATDEGAKDVMKEAESISGFAEMFMNSIKSNEDEERDALEQEIADIQEKGYFTTKLEEMLDGNLDDLRDSLADFKERIHELNRVAMALDGMDTTGLDEPVKEIRIRLKDPMALEEVRSLFESLKIELEIKQMTERRKDRKDSTAKDTMTDLNQLFDLIKKAQKGNDHRTVIKLCQMALEMEPTNKQVEFMKRRAEVALRKKMEDDREGDQPTIHRGKNTKKKGTFRCSRCQHEMTLLNVRIERNTDAQEKICPFCWAEGRRIVLEYVPPPLDI